MTQVLIYPIITEKALAKITDGCYTFKVAPKVNKIQIAEALKNLYKVDAVKVNIVNVKKEKVMLRGKFSGEKKGWKKAIITLKKGQKIPGFEAK